MKQIGVDLCTLPEVDGYRYMIVCMDYFSKWSEAKAVQDKSAPTIAQFELMCRHGCFAVQINDEGREFVNAISEDLHKLTGVEQRITSAYHPEANGPVDRQNRTIKNSLVKVIKDNPSKWPYIIEGILIAHRVSCHSSTKCSPFKLMYNRDPVLPIDVKHNLLLCGEGQDPFDKETFDAVLSTALKIREAVTDEVAENIFKKHRKSRNRTSIVGIPSQFGEDSGEISQR